MDSMANGKNLFGVEVNFVCGEIDRRTMSSVIRDTLVDVWCDDSESSEVWTRHAFLGISCARE